MSIWITRPRDDGLKLQLELRKFGLSSVVGPLSEVAYLTFDLSFLEDVKLGAVRGLVATSRNGVRGFVEGVGSELEEFESLKRLPLFAVGEATAGAARSCGFDDVRVGKGRAASLVEMVLDENASSDYSGEGYYLYLRGDKIAFDFIEALKQSADCLKVINVNPVYCYRMVEVEALAESLINQITAGEISSVLLMSPRAARIYKGLLLQFKLADFVGGVHHCCLSEAVASQLLEVDDTSLTFSKVSIAELPDQQHMIELLKTIYLS